MDVKLAVDLITPSINRINKRLRQLPRLAYNEFVRQTPKRSGRARRRTQLKNNTIHANYPYASRLDEGWSRQAPDGMTKPTEQYIKDYVDQTMRK